MGRLSLHSQPSYSGPPTPLASPRLCPLICHPQKAGQTQPANHHLIHLSISTVLHLTKSATTYQLVTTTTVGLTRTTELHTSTRPGSKHATMSQRCGDTEAQVDSGKEPRKTDDNVTRCSQTSARGDEYSCCTSCPSPAQWCSGRAAASHRQRPRLDPDYKC